jgi:hypothetical protein
MRQRLVITDVTQMPQGDEVCVVGINEDGVSVRPVCGGGFKKIYRYCNNRLSIYERSEVEFDFIKDRPQPPHCEDKLFNPENTSFIGECSEMDWEQKLINNGFSSVEQIFAGHLVQNKYVLPGTCNRSIATLNEVYIDKVKIMDGKGAVKTRLLFKDGSGCAYDLPVSDLAVREVCFKLVRQNMENAVIVAEQLTDCLMNSRKIYLRIGLARPWTTYGQTELRCYPQITAIHLFGDDIDSNDIYNKTDNVDTSKINISTVNNMLPKGGPSIPKADLYRTDGVMDESAATEILEALANGVDPFTGEILEQDSPFNNPIVIRALFFTLNKLKQGEPIKAINKETPVNAGNSWSNEEIVALVKEFQNSISVKQIAAMHGRTVGAINSRLMQIGLFKIDHLQ